MLNTWVSNLSFYHVHVYVCWLYYLYQVLTDNIDACRKLPFSTVRQMFRMAAVKDSENSEYLEYIPTLEAWAKVRATIKSKLIALLLSCLDYLLQVLLMLHFSPPSMCTTSIGQQVISSTVNPPPEVFDLTV